MILAGSSQTHTPQLIDSRYFTGSIRIFLIRITAGSDGGSLITNH